MCVCEWLLAYIYIGVWLIWVWSPHLGDLHDLDGRQLASLDVPALVDLAIGAITHYLYEFKYSSGVLSECGREGECDEV